MPLNPRIDGPLTNDEQRIVTRIIEPFPGIECSLIERLVRLGYNEFEIKAILRALELNASTANIKRNDSKRIPWINREVNAIIQRFKEALNTEQYDILLSVGYTQSEIGNILFTNLLPTAQLLTRTASAHASGEYQRLYQLRYTDVAIRSLIRAGFTVSQLRSLTNRMKDAQRIGIDAQGLRLQEINDMLFKKRSINTVPTLGIVQALLSGIHSKVREGEVARCIIDYVTMFDVPYGPGGTDGQVDVGTRHLIIETKVDSVPDGGDTFKQIRRDMTNDVMNPPDVNGVRKAIILYAPGYGNPASASIQAIGGYVVKSCEQLHEEIRLLGGP